MKDTPILFSGAMVSALLSGTKTQTRRVVAGKHLASYRSNPVFCPFGVPGDKIWVRERHLLVEIEGRCAGNSFVTFPDGGQKYKDGAYYLPGQGLRTEGLKWRPGMFLPRWSSRISLLLTGVRVERLQQITESDAQAEGIVSPMYALSGLGPARFVVAYRHLWDSLNEKRGLGWLTNPWVWVLEFKREGKQ